MTDCTYIQTVLGFAIYTVTCLHNMQCKPDAQYAAQGYFWDGQNLFHERTTSDRMNLILFLAMQAVHFCIYFALIWTLRILWTIHSSQGPIISFNGPSKF